MLLRLLLLFILLFWAQPAIAGQSPLPKLKSVQIELWPEYDRPETLVIYRAELDPTTPLPARLTFRLPGYVEDFHVVAVERAGVLVELDRETIEWSLEGNERLLAFSTPEPKLQFEYYDPQILSRAGQRRQLHFELAAPYEVETATFQVQEPVQTENFALTPPATSSFSGDDGLKYHAVQVTGLGRGETFSLTASYERRTGELSAQPSPGDAADLAAAPGAASPQNLTLGYILIAIGVVLLLGVGGYWWWSNRVNRATARPDLTTRRPALRKKRPGRKSAKEAALPQPAAALSSHFCYRCGAALRDEANFCHVCGAERRK